MLGDRDTRMKKGRRDRDDPTNSLVCDEIADLQAEQARCLVKTLACGICGSDLHALHHMEHMIDLSRRAGAPDGGFDPTADTVFGHEFCAEILDHGPGSAKTLKAGTRVVSDPGHHARPAGWRPWASPTACRAASPSR